MSAAPGLERSALRPRSSGRRPPLALVPPRRPEPGGGLGRTPFVVLVVTLLGTGLLGLLVLHTVLAQDAFRLHALKQDSRVLEDSEQVLRREVEALRAPHALATRAAALGMVPAGPPAFLRLPDGAVLGAGAPAPDGAAQVPPPQAPPAQDAPAQDVPAQDVPAQDAPEQDAPEPAADDATATESAEDAP